MLKKYNIPDSVIVGIVGWKTASMLQVYNDSTVDDEIGKYFDEDGVKKDIKDGKLSDLK